MIDDDSKPRSLAEVIRRALDARIADVHTVIPARVARVNLTAGGDIESVDAQPVIKAAHLDERGERVAEALPVIVKVPVQFPSGGGYRITFPIAEGDPGALLFSEASLDVWLAKGGTVDPVDDRRFALADAIFLPGVRDFAHPWGSVPKDRMTLGKDGGLQIHIDGSKVKIGSSVDLEVDAVALATPIKAWMNSAITAFAAHTHGTPVGPSTPAVGALPTAPDLDSKSVFAKKT